MAYIALSYGPKITYFVMVVQIMVIHNWENWRPLSRGKQQSGVKIGRGGKISHMFKCKKLKIVKILSITWVKNFSVLFATCF